jgi:glycosyltransferase involved in cell wall biosynthesis
LNSKISIIVPVYNAEQFLCNCIDSILNQQLKDIEIILVDDGSSDKSGEICDYYAQLDKRVQVLHLENQGASNARNRGIELASGDFIGFVDAEINTVNRESITKTTEKATVLNLLLLFI